MKGIDKKVSCVIKRYDLNYNNHLVYQYKSKYFIEQLKDIFLNKKDVQEYIPSIIFIDGNHYFDIIKYEVDYFLSILPQNAMMFLHDTYPQKHYYENKINAGRTCDSYKIRHYLEDKEDLFTFTWPYTASYCGLTMIMKKDLTRL